MPPFPLPATAEGAQFNGRPFPATASAEGRQFNGAPSLRERVRVRGFVPRLFVPLPQARALGALVIAGNLGTQLLGQFRVDGLKNGQVLLRFLNHAHFQIGLTQILMRLSQLGVEHQGLAV